MNAVNLIPLERRRSEVPSLPGLPFLGLLAALLLAFVGTFAYVGARNEVVSRQGELARVRAATAQWAAVAARYTPAISALRQHAKQFAELGALLGQRADWSQLLSQIAGVMPAHAELSSLSATAAAPTTGTAPATTGTGPATAPAAASAAGGSGITITGCAVSQPVVADTMVALRRLSGVSTVSLSNSSLQDAGGSSSGASAGTCKLPVQFSLALVFTPSTDLVHLLQVGTAGHPTTAAAPAATQTTPASTSTGAAR